MLFPFLSMVLRVVLRLAPVGDERDSEAAILVLRHQVKVLYPPHAGRLADLFDEPALRHSSRGCPRCAGVRQHPVGALARRGR